MGYYIRCEEIYEYYDLTKNWCERMEVILGNLEKNLIRLSKTQSMRGESAEGIQNYIKQFYLRIIPGIRVVLESLESNLRHYTEEYQINIDGAEDAVFCEDAFSEYIAEMEKQMNSISYFHEQIEMIIRNVDFADIRKPGVYSFEEVNHGLTHTIQSLAEDVAEMESQHAKDTQEAEELASMLSEFMQSACFQPLQQSISATVERLLESEELGKLDLSIAYMQEKVRQDNLQERMEDCSEEYFEWLKRNRVENYYFMIDDSNPNYIIGDCMININIALHSQNMGAISYSIRTTERNKHYGTHMLGLLLNKCQQFGLREVSISCLETNLTSKKVIENNGGKLEKRYFDIKSCEHGLKYLVPLEEPIKTLVHN